MPYEPQTWVDETGVGDGTTFTAARMNHMEDGIVEAQNNVFVQDTEPPQVVGNVWIDTSQDPPLMYVWQDS